MIWFTSDTHYNHKNICRGTSEWKENPDIITSGTHSPQRTREFDTLEDMNSTIVKNINDLVKENDTLYHLGDWSFGGINSIWDFRKQLNVQTIHYILGNHCHHIENNRVLPNVIKYGSEVTKAQDLFTSVQHYKEVSINGRIFVLSHYAHRVWNKSHHGAIHLYGHSHGTIDNNYGLSMDVGLDTWKEFRPYSITEIIDIMSRREALIIDHHNKNTN